MFAEFTNPFAWNGCKSFSTVILPQLPTFYANFGTAVNFFILSSAGTNLESDFWAMSRFIIVLNNNKLIIVCVIVAFEAILCL